MQKITVNIELYGCDVTFLVNCTPKEGLELLKPKSRTPDITDELLNLDERVVGLVFCEDGDVRRQFCYLKEVNMENPESYGTINHEIYHIVNNICHLKGLEDDGQRNEHIANLIGYVTHSLYAGLFGISVKKLAI